MKAWIVDDDESIRWVLQRALGAHDVDVKSFPGGVEMLDELESDSPDVLLTDIRMPGIDGLKLLERVKASAPELPIIIMTAHSDLDSAVAAYRKGAFEYLPKPFDVDDAVELVQRAARIAGESQAEGLDAEQRDAIIVGEAPAMQEVFRAIGRLTRSQITVMITGESGTGKELVARALHEHSPRAGKPFIAVNTAAIPKDLMESEFFGHEKGAFTGATALRRGRFEQAHGGTLFLDEIGDMPADLQTRLLRVLSDGEFYRVGGHIPVRVDVRVIAATNQDLESAVDAGKFREDLYHRLNVIRVRIPPLRERKTDLPLLMTHFMARAARELDVEPKRILPDAMTRLQEFDWPGNVRQAENVCRWMTVMAPGQDIHADDLPPEILGATPSTSIRSSGAEDVAPVSTAAISSEPVGAWDAQLATWARQSLADGSVGVAQDALLKLEQTLMDVALEHSHGHKQEAARLLGWGRNTLTRKLKEHGRPD